MQADYLKLSTCFPTKDLYGFMVGCKKSEIRPKMDPKYSPNWSGAHGPKPCRNWAPKSPKSVSFSSSPDEPIDHLKKLCWTGQRFDRPIDKNPEILIWSSLKNKESNKKKRCTILSSDEWDMIKISPYAPYLNLLLRTPTEHKFLGGLISFPMAWCEQLGKLAMKELLNELHTHTTVDHKWTYTRLRNRSRPKGGHDGVI